MKKHYYGLRIMSGFYRSLAVIIVIISIAGMGFLAADAFLTTRTVDSVTGSTLDWTVQALMILLVGGLSALTCYVLGQLIDAQIATHDNTLDILDRLNEIDLRDTKTDQLLQKQIRMIRAVYADEDASRNVQIPVDRSERLR